MTELLISDKDLLRQCFETEGLKLSKLRDVITMANKLSRIAMKDPAWSSNYMYNVLAGRMKAGADMRGAMLYLLTPQQIEAKAGKKTVSVLGKDIPHGTIVLVNPKQCARPGCPIIFLGYPARKWCSDACKREHKEAESGIPTRP